MNTDSRIYVAGHKGLVGSAILSQLTAAGYTNLITASHAELDLTNQQGVNDFFLTRRPEFVFMAAAKVGGIHANNTYPAEFIYKNLAIQTNVINACNEFGTQKLEFLGSVCIYPKFAPVPVKESSLMDGILEPTNQWYAIAKIAGIKMCQAYRKQYGNDFISVMPCNLYGPNDNFHPENSHVIPALIRRFVDAKNNNTPSVTCWGTGNARREFLYIDDMASACIFLMDNYSQEDIINIGFGTDYTIKEIVTMIASIVGYEGEVIWDTTKPDGTAKRLLDTKKLSMLGWKPQVDLRKGLTNTIEWYKLNILK